MRTESVCVCVCWCGCVLMMNSLGVARLGMAIGYVAHSNYTQPIKPFSSVNELVGL